MMFRPELALKVMEGRKTVTRRRMSPKPRSPWYRGGSYVKEGKELAVCPGRGRHRIGRVRVTSVHEEALGWLSDAEARREGFESAEAFVEAWSGINGTYKPGERVWVVRFEVCETVPCSCLVTGPVSVQHDRKCVWHGDHGVRVAIIRV